MNTKLHLQVLAVVACLVAVWLSWQMANENYALPLVVGGATLFGITVVVLRSSAGAVILAAVLFGYIVGNRGFAQVMPAPWLPLLPAELALVIAGSWCLVQCAYSRQLPFRREPLNWILLLWLAVGTARAIVDVRTFGLMAVRDYAMVYYALFFFLAQYVATEARARRFLLHTLLAASLAQPVVAVLAEVFPNFFYGQLTFRGVPLIAFKGDLALTFAAVSALLVAFLVPARHRNWAWPVATLEILYVVGASNRASMLGALAALGWLSISRGRRFVAGQIGAIALAVLLLAGAALLTENSWAQRKFDSVSERVTSLGDVFGARTYVSEESFMKGDNNRFRAFWWRAVIDETVASNPVFGLGFGYDLARNFLQEYNPEMAEDFTARSPHSIVVSTFGRMGLVGLLVFILLTALLIYRTWHVMRDPASPSFMLGFWASIWVILISACFGVVLEGPMGAVVFWSLLGIANVPRETEPDPALAEAGTTVPLSEPTALDQLARSP